MAPVLTASTCADGVVTASVLTAAGSCRGGLQLRSGRHGRCWWGRGAWSFDPSVTSVTVTATLRSPNINGWSALSGGWVAVEGDATSATLTVS